MASMMVENKGVMMLRLSRRALAPPSACPSCRRTMHDGRNRLSTFWTPTTGMTGMAEPGVAGTNMKDVDSNFLLRRTGFLRLAYKGIYHLLPLGLRVQEKIEKLIDKHMCRLGASKVSLSSLSSANLWEKSGRLKKSDELFQFKDRTETKFLLAPTHEEEITMIAANLVQSHKDLPLRLYQISRKYRDEIRPREGLLRGREFLMKDLYTFDYSAEEALKTYNAVREAYSAFFDDLKIPYIQAEADSGNMGGNLSHEFHIASAKGEDQIVGCSSCDYVSNEELAESGLRNKLPEELQKGKNLVDSTPIDQLSTIYDAKDECRVWTGITSDELTLVNVYYPWDWGNADASTKYPFDSSDYSELNTHLLRKLVPGVDLSGPKSVISWRHKFEATRKGTESHDLRTVHIIDSRIPKPVRPSVPAYRREPLVAEEYVRTNPITGSPLNLKKIDAGDPCPRCADGKLETTTAIELGHTFFLGTRYSSVLGATVAVDPGRVDTPSELLEKPTRSSVMEDDGGKPQQAVAAKKTNSKSQKPESTTTSMVPLQMGCHGIGVSRMIAAVADCLADSTGLNWPRLIAPFEVVVVYSHGLEEAGTRIYDDLVTSKDATIDAILDDRAKSLPYKLTDADLIGYPVIVGMGKSWRERQHVEVQCRRLNVRKIVSPDGLPQYVESLLRQL